MGRGHGLSRSFSASLRAVPAPARSRARRDPDSQPKPPVPGGVGAPGEGSAGCQDGRTSPPGVRLGRLSTLHSHPCLVPATLWGATWADTPPCALGGMSLNTTPTWRKRTCDLDTGLQDQGCLKLGQAEGRLFVDASGTCSKQSLKKIIKMHLLVILCGPHEIHCRG